MHLVTSSVLVPSSKALVTSRFFAFQASLQQVQHELCRTLRHAAPEAPVRLHAHARAAVTGGDLRHVTRRERRNRSCGKSPRDPLRRHKKIL